MTRDNFSISGDIHGNIVSGSGNSVFSQAPESDIRPEPTPPDHPARSAVLVVHGRDEQVRREVFQFLRMLDLRPLEWEEIVAAGRNSSPYLWETLGRMSEIAQAAIVLLTPDDVVQLHPKLRGPIEPDFEARLVGQPRPNVLVELGMVLAVFRERAVFVQFGDIRPIVDLPGRNVIRFDGSAVSVAKLVERLKAAGCRVDDTGSDWRDLHAFADLDAYYRRP